MFPNDRKRIIIHEVHKMLRCDSKAKVLAAHCGYKSIYQKIAEWVYWNNVTEDIK